MHAQRAPQAPQVAPQILERVGEPEFARDALERGAQPRSIGASSGVVAAVGGLVSFQVLGRDRWPPEDELVAVVAPVQHLAGDRVVEGLGALGLAVLVQQRNVRQLDGRPDCLVKLRFRETVEDAAHRFLDTGVVHLDSIPRERAQRRPVRRLEVALGLARGVAEKAVMLVEAGEDRARHLRGARRAGQVQRQDLRRRGHPGIRRPSSPAPARPRRRIARPRSSRAAPWSRPCRR